MRGQPLDIVESQSVAREYLFERMNRKIRKMLVVDRIEFDLLRPVPTDAETRW